MPPRDRRFVSNLPLTFLLSMVFLAAPPSAEARRPPPKPLKASTLGEGGAIVVRSLKRGLEVTVTAGKSLDASSMWVSLRTPRGGSSGNRTLAVPSRGKTARALVERPSKRYQDRDLRLVLNIREGDGRIARFVAAVSRFHRGPRVLLLGDSAVAAGSRYSPRIVVRLTGGGSVEPLAGAHVRVVLAPDRKSSRQHHAPIVATGLTDASGATNLQLKIPEKAVGTHGLTVSVQSPEGEATASFPVTVRRQSKVLLSTDKPIYQPGQTVHVRLLARSAGSGHAAGGAPARFAIHDAKNNKVFQKRGKTSAEGVFATSFAIATLVNTGRWRIEAEVGGTRTERTVEVKPYVLPKFKVTVTPERTSYQPGDTVVGTVTGRYFFGKPVAKGKVVLHARTFDVAQRELARLKLTLDDTGTQRFSFRLPSVLHGQPMLQGAAALRIEARVTDTAGQSYRATRSLPVWKDKLRVTVLPEAGKVIPGVDNRIYVLVTRPDGTPAKGARVAITYGGGVTGEIVDDTGVAVWRGRPAGSTFKVIAQTPDGNSIEKALKLTMAGAARTQVLLRLRSPAPKVGDHVRFDVLVGGGAVPHAFVDLIRDGQTLLTLSAPVHGGRARFSTTLPADAAGTLLAHAYVIGSDMEVYADTRPMVVRMASDLRIDITADKKTYRPGQPAAIDLKVTDDEGQPVLAALGLWVVDEAVFALSELRPGMEKVFFLLAKEIMRPKVEIHGFEPFALLRDPRGPGEDAAARKRDRAAQVLGAASMARFTHAKRVDSLAEGLGRSRTVWQKAMEARVASARKAIKRWIVTHRRLPPTKELRAILARVGIEDGKTPDFFGVPLKVTPAVHNAAVLSAGPDARWGTPDDLRAGLGVREAQQTLWRRDRRRFRPRPGRAPMAARQRGGGGFEDQGVPVDGLADAGEPENKPTETGSKTPKSGESKGPRIRSYFPETLYVNPLLLTDAEGHARITIPMADSITTWRMSALASSADGLLGSTDRAIRVFQDFFVDLDLPVSLTRGDEVTVPLAVYNYLDGPQTVSLEIATEGGVRVQGARKRSIRLAPGEVKGIQVDLLATTVGNGRITVMAKGSHLSDAVRRDVRVVPDGFALVDTRSGMLERTVTLPVEVPKGAIEDASTLQVKLYPGMFAQVVDGLEGMLKMPSGCFEQTSSSTYPNILVLRYLREAKKSKPELEAKALRYLQAGWQRLVTYEVPGGGFSWFGNPPSNRILTAYGLMEFFDMNGVYEIDAKVIARTRAWILEQQNSDGSFSPDKAFLHQESWGDLQKSNVLVTAYIAWALAYTRADRTQIDPALRKALSWLKANADEADDAYVLSYLANTFAEAAADRPGAGGDRAAAERFLGRLAALAVKEDGKVHFPTTLRTATHGSGKSAVIEVTALSLRAFMRAQSHMDLVGPGLEWLVGTKTAWGHWHSTQATIQVLQAMIASLSAQQEATAGSVQVKVNGAHVSTVRYSKDDFDVVRFIDASSSLRVGTNHIELLPSKGLKAMFTVSRTAYLPWKDERRPKKQAFEVDVKYDRTKLEKDDTVGVRVTVRSNLGGKAQMGIVDIGVPPGFVVDTALLEAAVKAEKLQRYSLAGRQIILYVPEFTPKKPFQIGFRLRARFPVRVSTGATRAYEYYNPANEGVALPREIRVSK